MSAPRQPRKTPASASNTFLVLCAAFFVLALVFLSIAAMCVGP